MTRLEWLQTELEEIERILFDFSMEREVATAVGDTENLKAYGTEMSALNNRKKVILKMIEREKIPPEQRAYSLDFDAAIMIRGNNDLLVT